MLQGSIFGSLIFFIDINSLTHEVQLSEVKLFADDTVLYVIVDNVVESAAALNIDLQHVYDWATGLIVKCSAPKTKPMLITKQNVVNHFSHFYGRSSN